MAHRAGRPSITGAHVALAVFWLAAFDFCLRTLDIPNDQFGRIAPGRQILTFGELPFRDFLDPGYFLTEFSSAAMQWLFGQSLMGEVLLNSTFVVTGCLFVCLVARRLGAGLPASIATGTLALIAMPRAYDYDKVLFYPLTIWLALRWFERPQRPAALSLAVGLVVAALYRYDNGVFTGLAVLTGLTILYWDNPRRFIGTAVPLVVALVCLCVPVLLFLQATAGIGNAVDQAVTYGLREGARTRIRAMPRIRVGPRVVTVIPSPPSGNHVQVRWSPIAVAAPERRQNATRLGLQDEQPSGPAEDRTFLYTLSDPSPVRITGLLQDPHVEDTGGIDRRTSTLLNPEPWWFTIERLSPVFRFRVLPEAWTSENAEAVLYYLLILLPIAGVAVLVVSGNRRPRIHLAPVTMIVALCVLLDVFILRDPINARVGGMAGPFAILGWYLASALQQRFPRGARVAIAVLLLLVAVSLAGAVRWTRQLEVPFAHPREMAYRLSVQARTPPALELLPSGRIGGPVDYVRRCTSPTDRVFTTWFTPQLFYFAQRGFGGAMSAVFGGHWSETRFQQRSVASFEAHSTPVVIIQESSYRQFEADYPLLVSYIAGHYRLGGITDFDDPEAGPDAYRVLVRTDRPVTRTEDRFGLPCFTTAPL